MVAEIEGGGGSATFRLTLLADLESARDLVERATLAGDGHVDILVADLIVDPRESGSRSRTCLTMTLRARF